MQVRGGSERCCTSNRKTVTNRVIAYASRSLSKTEKNYDAHKLEFLALKWSITERFHEYLYGGKLDVYTDNNPLTYVLTTAKLNAMGQRWIASLAHYDFQDILLEWTFKCRCGFTKQGYLGRWKQVVALPWMKFWPDL